LGNARRWRGSTRLPRSFKKSRIDIGVGKDLELAKAKTMRGILKVQHFVGYLFFLAFRLSLVKVYQAVFILQESKPLPVNQSVFRDAVREMNSK
jgi:hypothetical protein